jgi:predicted Fe-Mo cluster-binding NifX family protein
LASCVEPHLPNARHLLFFDTETRDVRHVALREPRDDATEAPRFDVVLCASFDKATREVLSEKGIFAFGTEARTAGEAIAEFEALNPPGRRQDARAHENGEHACKGGCGGRGHGKGHEAGQCACGGHGRDYDAISRKMNAEALRIAVSSQDRRTITGHAGRCRKFWVYEIRGNRVENKTLRELAPAQTLHSSPPGDGHPLDDVHVMITAGMSPFLYQRLQQGGIRPFVTEETDPDEAVRMLLEKVASRESGIGCRESEKVTGGFVAA